jgi:hypothetical protein
LRVDFTVRWQVYRNMPAVEDQSVPAGMCGQLQGADGLLCIAELSALPANLPAHGPSIFFAWFSGHAVQARTGSGRL